MFRTIRRMAVLATVLLVTAFGSVSVGQASASIPPDPFCVWIHFGYDSNCDGVPVVGNCLYERVQSVHIGGGIYVELYYGYSPSQGCQTVYAVMLLPVAVPPGSACYVKVERNYRDPVTGVNDAIRAGVPVGLYATFTNDLYDRGVTSYAWGTCRLGPTGTTYSGRTPNW